MPLNVLVGLVGAVMVPPDPPIMLHNPVPIAGVLAANVVEVNPHIVTPVWSVPALAIVGLWLNVIFISSVDGAHGALLMVQRNV